MTISTDINEVIIVNIDPKNSQTNYPSIKFTYSKYELPSGVTVEAMYRISQYRDKGNNCSSYQTRESWEGAIKKARKQFAEFN
jgi:hypothetical protein